MKKNSLIVIFLSIMSGVCLAAPPTWQVNSGAFSYDMTVTAIINDNCLNLQNTSNQIGAFVGNELRGTGTTATDVNGNFIAFFTISSNQTTGEIVNFKFYDADRDSIIETKTSLVFQEDKVQGSIQTPFVLYTNNIPTKIKLSKDSITENLSSGTTIGKFTVEDVDVNDIYSFTLLAGELESDSFSLKTDSLVSNTVFDFETLNLLSLKIRAEDPTGCFIEDTFKIYIKNANDAPIGLMLSKNTVYENLPLNTFIGKFSSTDLDPNETFTYQLVAGTGDIDNAKFTLSQDNLLTNDIFDFETQDTFKIRVRTSDLLGATYEEQFEIFVKDTNDIPTNIVLSTLEINENKPSGTTLAFLNTLDQDTNETFTYSFVDIFNNKNSSFAIYGNELKTTQSFDFETKNSYLIALKTTDSFGQTFSKEFTISILDSNDAPTNLTLSKQLVEEKRPLGTFVAKLSTTDIDAVDQFTYQLQTGTGDTDNASFYVSNDTLYTNEVFDLNTKQYYSIFLQTNDKGSLNFTKNFTIQVTNTNDTPTDIILDNVSMYENAASNQFVGNLSSIDEDANDSFTYTLAAGDSSTDNSKFTIFNGTLRAKAVFDFETQDTLYVRIKTTDLFGATFEKGFELYVKDTNDVPTDIVLSSVDFEENLPAGTTMCTLSTIDQDATDSYSYSFYDVFGNNNSSFVIYGNELKSTEILDFETKSSYLIAIKSTDSFGKSVSKQFTIMVSDSNDAPIAINISNSSINEKSTNLTFIGKFNTTDQDATDSFTYAFTSSNPSNDNASFIIKNDSLLSNTTLDFNTKNQYYISVKTTDKGGDSLINSFVIQVLDVNVAPTNLELNTLSLNENNDIKIKVAYFIATDEDMGDGFTYSFVSGLGDTDNALFSIKDSSLYAKQMFDFEQNSEFSIRIKVTDKAFNTFEQEFKISVVDVNESPIVSDTIFLVSEDAEENQTIGFVEFGDQDDNQTHTFVILDNNINTLPFELNNQTGEITLKNVTLNYEAKNNYELYVKISDNGSPILSDTLQVTINIQDEIEDFLPSSDYVSPNGDGINDTWTIKNVEIYEDYSLTIFTSYGAEIYHIDRAYDNSWDATYNGDFLPAGAYYFMLISNTDSNKIFKGAISVVK